MIRAKRAGYRQRATPGTVFTPALFTKAGSRGAIGKASQRLVERGILRRLSRGLHDKPREDEMLGILWPSVDEVVRALSGKDRLRLQPTGAYAANRAPAPHLAGQRAPCFARRPGARTGLDAPALDSSFVPLDARAGRS